MEIIQAFSSDSEMSSEYVEVNDNYRWDDKTLSEFWDRRDKQVQMMCDADDSNDSSIFHYGLHRNWMNAANQVVHCLCTSPVYLNV